jgi:hypothetical protein
VARLIATTLPSQPPSLTETTTMGQMIEIVQPDDVRDYQFVDPDTKVKYDSVFQIRVVPNDEQKKMRKRATTFENTRRGREERFDWQSFVEECLDYAITGWKKVQMKGQDLPCERQYKSMLPEIVRAEIVRLCVGRELGEIQAGQIGDGDGEAPAEGADPNVASGPSASGGLRTISSSPVAN